MTVFENLQMGATISDPARFQKDIERVYAMFPRLAERREQRGGTLSGGEQQMLAISRALMSRPKLVLFDEPSLGLAPNLVERTFDIIRDIRARGVTVVMVEQTQEAAGSLIEVLRAVAVGENVVQIGEDVVTGAPLLPTGQTLRSQDIGGLLALGTTRVSVARTLRVGIISSGDEVVDPDSDPVMTVVLSSKDMSLRTLTEIADKQIKRDIESVDGVAEVAFTRELYPKAIDLAVDMHGRYDMGTGKRVAKALEPLRLLWLEEPVPPENSQMFHAALKANQIAALTGQAAAELKLQAAPMTAPIGDTRPPTNSPPPRITPAIDRSGSSSGSRILKLVGGGHENSRFAPQSRCDARDSGCALARRLGFGRGLDGVPRRSAARGQQRGRRRCSQATDGDGAVAVRAGRDAGQGADPARGIGRAVAHHAGAVR